MSANPDGVQPGSQLQMEVQVPAARTVCVIRGCEFGSGVVVPRFHGLPLPLPLDVSVSLDQILDHGQAAAAKCLKPGKQQRGHAAFRRSAVVR